MWSTRWLLRFIALGAILASAVPSVAREPGLPLVAVATVSLPGSDTRFDYESLDPTTGLLFIAHLAASEIVVFDVRRDRVVATIPKIDRVHGVLAVPELGRVYATATGSDDVVVIDARSRNILARVPGGSYPDGMAFDPADHKLYVSDESGDTETVIDTRTNVRVATIPLGGDVGNSQYDRRTHRVFVNVQTRGELVAIDPTSDTIAARYFLPGCVGNHGLQLDGEHRHAAIACEDNARLVVFDLVTKKERQSFTIGDGPDVLAYDRTRSALYVASESGTVSMFDATARGMQKTAEAFVGTNAHIVAVDQRTHRVYFPVLGKDGPRMLVYKPRTSLRR